MRNHNAHVLIRWNCFGRETPRQLAWIFFSCAWISTAALNCLSQAVEEVTSFAQFRGLSLEQSHKGRPVRIKGVVLCYDLEWGQLYIHDGSETRWLNPREISARPAIGQFVEIVGKTTVTENYNWLTSLSLTVLREGTLPIAKRYPPARMTNDFGQWVETIGRVRVVDSTRGRMQFSLHEAGQGCGVIVLGKSETNLVMRLLGARVLVRGINDTKLEDGRLVVASLLVPGVDQITVLEPAESAPVLPQAMSIDSLLNRELGDWTNRPVRITGSVVSCEPGKSLIVKDPTGVLRAQIIQSTAAQEDDRVDVRGFLKVTLDETILSDAWFEVIKPTPLAAPITAPSLSARPLRQPELLTNVSQVLKLRKEESIERWPVRLQGVVLYADPEWRNGFLQDQRSAIYFDLGQNDVRTGQWVELTGETGPGGFAPEILNTSVRVLGATNLPLAAKVELPDMADGHLDAQWVELEGVIRRVNLEWGHLTVTVMTHRGRFEAVIPGLHNETAPTHLIDAFVSIQGACASTINTRHQVVGVTLHVPALDRITILEPPPADPFAVVATPIASVATFDPDRLAGRRIKISGVITLRVPNQGFYIQDDTGGIRVRLPQMDSLQPGDRVDVLGFPVLGDFSPELEEASVRRTGQGAEVAVHATTAEEILLHDAHDGMWVALKARLLQSVPRSANPQLVLQDGAIVFTARLEDAGQGWKMPGWQSGSVVRLAGICSIQRGEQREPKGFRLRLRSPADASLISSPPWWTAGHTLWVLGGIGAVLMVSLAWVRVLRREVARQTSKLRDQIAERERMQVQIDKTHRELLTVSRQAGMAEIATNVLHNVGNVLNSVNISTGLIAESVKKSRGANLARVAALLREHAHDLGQFLTQDSRGRHVPVYLAQLSEQLEAEQNAIAGEVDSLQSNVGHIKEIVAMQQSYAKAGGVKEMLDLVQLVEDSLRLNERALGQHQVEVVREFAAVPPVNVDKHKILQILVNLVRNAKHACQDSARSDKRLTVRVANGAGRIRISVADNGVGIPPENLTRIFNHGFTTRKDGHGFGLHSGALAARELGGALTVQSDGPGLGATFTLELPCRSAENAHEHSTS